MMTDTPAGSPGLPGENQNDILEMETNRSTNSGDRPVMTQPTEESIKDKVKNLQSMVAKLGSFLLASMHDQLDDIHSVSTAEAAAHREKFKSEVETLMTSLKGYLKSVLKDIDGNMPLFEERSRLDHWEKWTKQYFINDPELGYLTVGGYLDTQNFTEKLLRDAHINWGLQYLQQRYSPDTNNVAIISTFDTLDLLSYYLDFEELADNSSAQALNDLRAKPPYLRIREKVASKRYVVIPVNLSLEGNSSGNHWTFMFADKEETSARMIDGNLKYVPERGDWRPQGQSANTEVGAKIIVALESLLDLPNPGGFKPKMLRFIPYQDGSKPYHDGDESDDDDLSENEEDVGISGPYLLHMLGYLLKNFQLVRAGLKESFTFEKWKDSKEEIAFNSLTARKTLLKHLFGQRKLKELHESHELFYKDPFYLTDDVLRLISMESVNFIGEELARRYSTRHGNRHGYDNSNDDEDGDGATHAGPTEGKRKARGPLESSSHTKKKTKPSPAIHNIPHIGNTPPVPTSGTHTGNTPPVPTSDTHTGSAPPVTSGPSDPQPLPRIDLRDFADGTPGSREALQPYIDRLLAALPALRSRIYDGDTDTLLLTNPSSGSSLQVWAAIPFIQQAFEGGWNGVEDLAERVAKEGKKTAKEVIGEWCKLAFPRGTKTPIPERCYAFGANWGKTILRGGTQGRDQFIAAEEVPDLRSKGEKERVPRAEIIVDKSEIKGRGKGNGKGKKK